MRNFLHDAWRMFALFAAGFLVLKSSLPLSLFVGEPALFNYGTLAGFVLMGLPLVHLARRVLFPSVGMIQLAATAAPGHVFLGVCIVLAALILDIRPVQAAELPQGAVLYIPTLKTQQLLLWPDIGTPSTLAAQVEQETCPSLKSKSCWNPHAELKTSREYGFGLGQCTVTAHFSCFQDMQKQVHWTWSQRFDPDKQIAALILKDLQCFDPLHGTASPADRLAMAYACYNGGAGGLASDRRMCSATPGCDPGKWFGSVEHTSYKARLAVPGYGQSFFQINRGYVANIMGARRLKYRAAMGDV